MRRNPEEPLLRCLYSHCSSVRVAEALARECMRHDAWYLGYECQCCGAKIPIRADDSKGEAAIGGIRLGLVRLACPHCGRGGFYSDARLLRFKFQASPPQFDLSQPPAAAVETQP